MRRLSLRETRQRIYPTREAFETDRVQYERDGWHAVSAAHTPGGIEVFYRRGMSPQNALALIVVVILIIGIITGYLKL